jgi:hypothetical protein
LPDTRQPGGLNDIIRIAAPAFLILLALKLHFATVLDLYSDEVFYWLEASRPALAYSDLPFMTALLTGIGNSLAPGSSLAVRSVFLLLGTSLPFVVYWLARAVTDRRQACEAGALALCLPLGGFLGLLAVPDVPLIFFGLLATGCFLRALQSDRWSFWLATGVFVACGLGTHYRFLLYPAAVFFFLLAYSDARRCWKNPRFWVAVAIASIGLVPVLWFNLNQQLASAAFYLVERHPWEFQPMGLAHLFKQAGLVTPPLYALLLFTLWLMWKEAKKGQRGAAVLLSLGLTNLLVYLVLAPWTDATSTSIHWPLSAYFPILVYVPAALRELIRIASSRYSPQSIRLAISATIGLGFLGSVVAIVGVGSQAYQLPLQNLIGPGILSNKMAGWQEFADYSEALIDTEFTDTNPILVTDNYYTAAQLEFAGFELPVFTLDEQKAVRDGRMRQLQLWEMDTRALQSQLNQDTALLLITEDSTLEVEAKRDLLLNACEMLTSLRAIGQLILYNGDKQFSFYRGEYLLADAGRRAPTCPQPMRAWIDQPAADAQVSGVIEVGGWAYSEEIGVASVELIIDEVIVGSLQYGNARPDVAEVMNVTSDPNSPALGYSGTWDTRSVANGWHTLAIEIRNAQGSTLRYGRRRILINN